MVLAKALFGAGRKIEAQLVTQKALTLGGFLLWERKDLFCTLYEFHLKICKGTGDKRSYTAARE